MNAPTPLTIATRMEKALPGERRAALHACARDVAELFRMRQLSKRQVNEWSSALQLWGERRAGLRWSEAATEISYAKVRRLLPTALAPPWRLSPLSLRRKGRDDE
jgi:hypothetical protein